MSQIACCCLNDVHLGSARTSLQKIPSGIIGGALAMGLLYIAGYTAMKILIMRSRSFVHDRTDAQADIFIRRLKIPVGCYSCCIGAVGVGPEL